MRGATVEGVARVWLYEGPGGWHFLTLPKAMALRVEAVGGGLKAFGSVPVEVTIGATTWRTSVFPDSRSGSYVLPIKKDVRRAEGIEDGTRVRFTLRL